MTDFVDFYSNYKQNIVVVSAVIEYDKVEPEDDYGQGFCPEFDIISLHIDGPEEFDPMEEDEDFMKDEIKKALIERRCEN